METLKLSGGNPHAIRRMQNREAKRRRLLAEAQHQFEEMDPAEKAKALLAFAQTLEGRLR